VYTLIIAILRIVGKSVCLYTNNSHAKDSGQVCTVYTPIIAIVRIVGKSVLRIH